MRPTRSINEQTINWSIFGILKFSALSIAIKPISINTSWLTNVKPARGATEQEFLKADQTQKHDANGCVHGSLQYMDGFI